MHPHRASMFRWCRKPALALLILLPAVSHLLWSQTESDESETLVMVARTSDSAILAVDSKMTASDGVQLDGPSLDAKRKIVNIGERSSCAVEGYVGPKDADVADALREWSASHPKVGAAEGLSGLLSVAANMWDQHHYTIDQIRKKGRDKGSPITTLTCVDFVDGHPVIVRGQTGVTPDLSAGAKTLDIELGDLLYFGGVMPDTG